MLRALSPRWLYQPASLIVDCPACARDHEHSDGHATWDCARRVSRLTIRTRDANYSRGPRVILCRGQAVGRVRMLREQAAVLRKLAGSFDIQPIRDQLLNLAACCEELAKSMEENPQAASLRQDDFPSYLH